MREKTKIDTTSFSLHINSKSNKSRDVKFIIAISKNPEHPLQKHFRNNICYVIDETDVQYPGIRVPNVHSNYNQFLLKIELKTVQFQFSINL